MWNWLRRPLEEKRHEKERCREEARERRNQKRLLHTVIVKPNDAPLMRAKQDRIWQEKQQFELDAAALMQLGLLEEELAEAVRDRRDTMLRRIKEILDEQ